MTRTITTTRLYSLQQYNNISFTETITLPEDTNEITLEYVRKLQLIQCDMNFYNYASLTEHTKQLATLEERMEYLEDAKETTLNSIENLTAIEKEN